MRAGSRWLRIMCAPVIVLAVHACSAQRSPSPRDWPLATVSEADVTVTLRAVSDEAHQAWVSATYTPTRSGFHLYSKDLPRDGLSGIGRPTLLELEPGGALASRGEPAADRKPVPLYVPVLRLSFPVYPEGPVTLRLPVTVAAGGDRRATVSVSYLACSDSTCLAPVTRKPIVVTLPEGFRPST